MRAFLHPLWDLQLVVGHQVRELDEFDELETDNPEFLLALLDARAVAGDATLLERVSTPPSCTRCRTRVILDALKR